MGTASGFVSQMKKWIGTGENPPGSNNNEIVRRYNAEVDKIGRGPWCDMTVTIAGIDSGNAAVVGKFAYTPSHAQWFVSQGRWHYGTAKIAPGAVVFFDWSGTRKIGNIDHVGVVERVSGGKIYTIEGNKDDKCVRVVRDATYIVGYGAPAFSKPKLAAPSGDPVIKKGQSGARPLMLQRCLNKVQNAGLAEDGDFGPKTEAAMEKFQGAHKDSKGKKLTKDGEYGKNSAWAMAQALK